MRKFFKFILLSQLLFISSISWANEHPLIGKSLICEALWLNRPNIYLFERDNFSLTNIYLYSEIKTKEVTDYSKTHRIKLGEIEEDALYWYIEDTITPNIKHTKIRLDRMNLKVKYYDIYKEGPHSKEPTQSQYQSGGGLYHSENCKIIGDIEDGKKELERIKKVITKILYNRYGRPLSKEEKETQLEEIKKNRKI
jgi:hypothetical protein